MLDLGNLSVVMLILVGSANKLCPSSVMNTMLPALIALWGILSPQGMIPEVLLH